MKNILYVAAECGPFIKTGGLGSVLASLPRELSKEDYDVRVVIPCYQCIPREYRDQMETVVSFPMKLNWRDQFVRVKQLKMDGETFYFIENNFYFCGDSPYNDIWLDIEKFSFFCKAVLEMLSYLEYQPDLIHCHDWQSSLVPVYLKSSLYSFNPFYSRIKTIMTIHNLRFQGQTDIDRLKDLTGLPDDMFTYDKLEYYNQANLLKGGIACADRITTVSRTYAGEICTPDFGEGLDSTLNYRKEDITGIVNGLDYVFYNPSKDPAIAKKYGVKRRIEGKAVNKKDLLETVGLPEEEDVLVLGIVGRLTEQKGLDLFGPILPQLMEKPVKLLVLGGGQPEYVRIFEEAREKYPDKVYMNVDYSDALAKKFYAGCDAILMPSRFEPCGLSQMMALRYGSVPVIRETGGLKDTVAVVGKSDKPTGFGFEAAEPDALLACLMEVCRVYFEDRDLWNEMTERGMKKNYSWKTSCRKYEKLYELMV